MNKPLSQNRVNKQSLKEDSKASIQFLKKYAPKYSFTLTAIIPGGGTTTATFLPKEMAKCEKWIKKFNGKQNLYFTVNPTNKALKSKAKKTDIAALAWLHVDIDPEKEKPIVQERARILKLIKNYKTRPTLVIDSGGGYQAFWKLDAVQPVSPSGDNIPELESYNKQLEIMFKADSCHNIDRIMRLPGTINIPNKAKLAKGRKKALAKVVWFEDKEYPLSTFSKAATIGQMPDTTVELGNVPDSVDLEGLGISERLAGLIRTGIDPVQADKYKSRSEALFSVATALVRHGCEDNIIAAILKNRDFKISESCLEHKRPEYYINRQITRAKEAAIAPELAELNEKHAVVMENGKTFIINEEWDPIFKRNIITRSSFKDLRDYYSNRQMVIGQTERGPVIVKLGKWWLDHMSRRQYNNITFAPGRETPGEYNLWRGFAADPIPGDWRLFKQHIFENICSDNQDHFDYLFNWMANAVQNPAETGQVAIVLRGPKGSGKSIFAKVFGKLFGQHFLQISSPHHLTGRFNAHLRDVVVLFADEAFCTDDKQSESILKTLITEESIIYEAKGRDPAMGPNYIHLIIASNHERVIPATFDERRFFFLDVSDKRCKDLKYFERLVQQMTNGGLEALLYDLKTLDLKKFEVRNVPITSGMITQQDLSMKPEEKFINEILQDGQLKPGDCGWGEENRTGRINKIYFYKRYVQFIKGCNLFPALSPKEFTLFLKRILAPINQQPSGGWPQIKQSRGREFLGFSPSGEETWGTELARPYYYCLPPLDTFRKAFDEITNHKHEWDINIEFNEDADEANNPDF